MKILRLDLLAYGPFTDASLELDGGEQGLHVVYGPNEAGKSSALRALRQTLFGIDPRTTDNFVHQHQDLRIGIALRSSAGTLLECIRRKGNKNTLRGPDDESLVDPAVLERLLPGIKESDFATRFGIDYKQLVTGGKAIAEGKDLGEILFAAASGVANLGRVQEQLAKDAADLFKPSASLPKLNAALRSYNEARKLVKESQLPSAEWVQHDKALHEALAAREKVQETILELATQRQKLARIQDSLPLLARRKQLAEEARLLADAPDLPEGFSDARRKLMEALAVAENSERNASETLASLATSEQTLHAPQDLLDQATAISELQTELGEHRKAAKDRPGLEAKQQQLESDLVELLRELGRSIPAGELENLRVPRARRFRIQELGNDKKGLAAGVENAHARLHKLKADAQRSKNELAAAESPRTADELRRLLARLQKRGDLEQSLAAARVEGERRMQQVELELRKLRPAAGTLAELEVLAVPTTETIDRFDRALEEAHKTVRDLLRDVEKAEDTARDVEQQIEQLRLQQDVPTEEDLATARGHREAGWQLVRAAWERGELVEKAIASYMSTVSHADDLGQAYEQSVEQADEVADRLRREAEKVANKARLVIAQRRAAERLGELSTNLAAAQAALAAQVEQWNESWREAKLAPLSPKEMRAWLAQHKALVATAAAIREQQAALEATQREIQSQRAELQGCLAELGEHHVGSAVTTTPKLLGAAHATLSGPTLAALVQFCEETVERIQTSLQHRQQLERDLAIQQGELPEAEESVSAAERTLAEWQTQWAAAIEILGLGGAASPSEANQVLAATEELFAKRSEADMLRERIEGIDRDSQRYALAVRHVTNKLATDLAEKSIDLSVTTLVARLAAAQQAQAQLDSLAEQRKREEQKLNQATQKSGELHARLKRMCQEAKCAAPEELPEAERRANRRQEVREAHLTAEQRLLALAAGSAVDDFAVEVASVNPDELTPRIRELEDQAGNLEKRRTSFDETIGSERNELCRMKGGSQAADEEERAQSLLAQIQSDATQYIRLKLGTLVLAKAVERYRERHQGPVLTRASELFAELTLGSFCGLRADYNEKGEAVLLGVRPGGKQAIGVDGMSDGTCDQMYLALRLASLEEFLRNNSPLPFIVDDILIKFDDDRAVAALKALARLSQQTQVIFFTHHEHLVALARECLTDDVLFVHTLAGEGAARSMA